MTTGSAPNAVWALVTRVGVALSIVMGGCTVLEADAATGARPIRGAHYEGFEGSGRSGQLSLEQMVGELRVSKQGRRFTTHAGGSYIDTEIVCAQDRTGRVVGRILLASAHRQVRISRSGRFRVVGRHRGLRFRLRGRFVSPDEANVVYSARERPLHPIDRQHPGVCKQSGLVTLYRNGQPPFRGCSTQPATTLVAASAGRVFEQLRPTSGGFIPNVYACLFKTNKRFRLGENYDELQINVPRLLEPFVGYSFASCGPQGPCVSSIRIMDLRDGKAVDHGLAACDSPPDSGPPALVFSLELKDDTAFAWIANVFGPPRGRGEVCAIDASGRRMLDSGPGIDLESLRLAGSTLTWTNNATAHSATLN